MTQWIITSSALILIIILLRRVLRGRISLRLQYALWGIVLLRLLMPFSLFESGLSLMNAVEELDSIEIAQTVEEISGPVAGLEDIEFEPDVTVIPTTASDIIIPSSTGTVSGYYPGDSDHSFPTTIMTGTTEKEFQQLEKAIKTRDVLIPLWLTGAAVMLCVFIASNLRFARILKSSRRELDMPGSIIPVYVSGKLDTPCLFGFFRPAIYLTPGCESDLGTMRHVLAHETTHYRHGDNIWAALRCLCLALHWYNPLVWWAAVLSKRDAELACDEGAIKRLGENERAPYGRTLIGLTCRRGDLAALALTATTMTGSGKSIKERISLIAKKPHMAVYTLVAVLLIAGVAALCTFSGANSGFTDREARKDARALAEGVAHVNYLEIDGRGEVSRYEGDFVEAGEVRQQHVEVSFTLKNSAQTIVVLYNMLDEKGQEYEEPFSAETFVSPTHTQIVPTDENGIQSVQLWKSGYENPVLPEEYAQEMIKYIPHFHFGERYTSGKPEGEGLNDHGFTVFLSDGSSVSFGTDYIEWSGYYYEVICPSYEPWFEEILNEAFFSRELALAGYMKEGVAISEEMLEFNDAILSYAVSIVQEDMKSIPLTFGSDTVIKEARIDSIEPMHSGVAGLERAVEVYRMDWSILIDAAPQEILQEHIYMVISCDNINGIDVWNPLGALSENELQKYSAADYIQRYGNIYTAAAAEMYNEFISGNTDAALPIAMVTGNASIGCYLHPRFSRTWTDYGWLMADGANLAYVINEDYVKNNIPTETYHPDIGIYAGYGTIEPLRVYDENMESVFDNSAICGIMALHWLEPGTYYCVFGVNGPPGRYIAEENAYEQDTYEAVFRLTVSEKQQGITPGSSGKYSEMNYYGAAGSQIAFRDATTIDAVLKLLGSAVELGYIGECVFDELIVLSGEGGSAAFCLAGDGCSTIYSDGKCWDIGRENMAALRNIISSGERYFYHSGSSEELVKTYAGQVYRQEMFSVPSGDDKAITDYRVINCQVAAESYDGKYVVGLMEYAFSPEFPELAHWWAGNTGQGEGEYEDMLVRTAMFTLRQNGKGIWECIEMGTGGYCAEYITHQNTLEQTWTGKAEEALELLQSTDAMAFHLVTTSSSAYDSNRHMEQREKYWYTDSDEQGIYQDWLISMDGKLAYREIKRNHQTMSDSGVWRDSESVYEIMNPGRFENLSERELYGIEFGEAYVTVSYVKPGNDMEFDCIRFRFDLEGNFCACLTEHIDYSTGEKGETCAEKAVTTECSFISFDRGEIELVIKNRGETPREQVYLTGSYEELVTDYMENSLRRNVLAYPMGGLIKMTDYKPIEYGVDALSLDGRSFVARAVYATKPEDPALARDMIAGNAYMGSGEYQGWIITTQYLTFTRLIDGAWAMVESNTGGVEWGYYSYGLTDAEIVEKLSTAIEEKDDSAFLRLLPLARVSLVAGSDFMMGFMDMLTDSAVSDYTTNDDQLIRDLYVMRGSLISDGALSEHYADTLLLQHEADSLSFARALSMLGAEEREDIEMLLRFAMGNYE